MSLAPGSPGNVFAQIWKMNFQILLLYGIWNWKYISQDKYIADLQIYWAVIYNLALLAIHFAISYKYYIYICIYIIYIYVNFVVNLIGYNQHKVGAQAKSSGAGSWLVSLMANWGPWRWWWLGRCLWDSPFVTHGFDGTNPAVVFSEQLKRRVLAPHCFQTIRLTGLQINENGKVLLREREGIAPTSEHASFPAKGRCCSLSSLLNIFTIHLYSSLTLPFSASSQTGEFPCGYAFLTGFN